jgi:hypothetical protein
MDRHELGQSSTLTLGPYRVDTTSNGGHPVEFWVDNVMDRLVFVSDSAPPVIRDQAMAYKETMRQTVESGMRSAITSNHTTLIYHLKKAGMHEAAALIATIRS